MIQKLALFESIFLRSQEATLHNTQKYSFQMASAPDVFSMAAELSLRVHMYNVGTARAVVRYALSFK